MWETNDRNVMVEQNIHLVRYVIHKYMPSAILDDDAYQEGCIALIEAVKEFNPELGFKFSTFATKKIINTIKMYYRSLRAKKRCASLYAISLDELINPDEGKDLNRGDLLHDDVDIEEYSINLLALSEITTHIDRLPVQQRKVFVLYYKHDLTQLQIAKQLGISQVNVSRELARATKYIKSNLRVA